MMNAMNLVRRYRIRSAFADAREDLYEKIIEALDKNDPKRTETLSALFSAWAEQAAKRSKPLAAALDSIAYKLNNEGRSFSETLTYLVPFEERMVIWAGEQQGELVEAVQQALRIKRTMDEMKKNARAASLQPLSAAFNMLLTSFVMGVLAWPELMRNLPADFWPAWTKPSISFDLWFARNWPVLVLAVPVLSAHYYSLSRWTGKARQAVDRFFPWNIYRDEQANVLLTSLAGLVRNKFTIVHACEQIRERATPYLRWHLNRVLPRLEALGDDGLRAFDTGLIATAVMDRLEDAKRTRDLDQTIQHVGDRSLDRTVVFAKRRAQQASVIATVFFFTLFVYSAAVQIIGTQDAGDAYAAKIRGHRR